MQTVFEKIIEKLEERTSFLSDCTKYGNKDAEQQNKSYSTMMMYEVADLVDDLIEIVKQEAVQYNNGWIPCSEPPKTSDYILLSFSNFSVPMVGRYEENEDGGAYYIGDEDKSCVSQDIFVNAWQPLPEQYNPKGE